MEGSQIYDKYFNTIKPLNKFLYNFLYKTDDVFIDSSTHSSLHVCRR